jgi:hypothetical protein
MVYSKEELEEFPYTNLSIRSPMELRSILARLRMCLHDNVLIARSRPESLTAMTGVEEIPLDGPWPDYIEAYFTDSAGNEFSLAVETYHGAGGTWESSELPE